MPTEEVYGIVTVLQKLGEPDRFLILHQTTGNWSFPKGHPEGTESPKETALRELQEEAGITEISLFDAPLIEERYTFERNGVKTQKINHYFVGIVTNDEVSVQSDEIDEYKWATYKEALTTFTYKNPKEILGKAFETLKNYGK